MRPTRRRLTSAAIAVIFEILSTTPAARAYSITSYEWNEPVTLRLLDGRQLDGQFHGMLGAIADTTPYAQQYEAWRAGLGLAAPGLGETLLVARSGHADSRGAFRGFADGDLLLTSADSCRLLVVRPARKTLVRRADDATMDPDWIAARGRWKTAPSPHVLIVKTSEGIVAVPAAMIASRSLQSSHAGASSVAAGVAAGLLLGLVIGGIAAATAMAHAFSHGLV